MYYSTHNMSLIIPSDTKIPCSVSRSVPSVICSVPCSMWGRAMRRQ